MATTEKDHSKEALITVYIWPKGTEERALFSTRSNIQSCLGHEYNGHFIKGYRHINNQFDPTYNLEKSNPVWKKTTKAYKDYINKVIKQNGYK